MPYKNKDRQRAYQNQWYKNRRLQWIASKGGKCFNCGSKDALEVDHIDPKTKDTHRIWSWTKSRRQVELDKCQVLCIECHMAKTSRETPRAEHGTNSRYNNGCRCDKCKHSHMLAMRGYRASIKLNELAESYSVVGD